MSWLSALISPVTSIASKLIMDKDKFAELQFKKTELNYQLRSKLLDTTTTPTMDAWIKLLVAFRDVVLPLLRPLGAAVMTGFFIYCQLNEIELTETTQAVLVAAFPAWGTSRHFKKIADD